MSLTEVFFSETGVWDGGRRVIEMHTSIYRELHIHSISQKDKTQNFMIVIVIVMAMDKAR